MNGHSSGRNEDAYAGACSSARSRAGWPTHILAGFVGEGATVEVDALPDGGGLTLTTDAGAPSADAVTAPAAEA